MEGIDSIEKLLKAARLQNAANDRTKTLVRFRLDLSEVRSWAKPYEFLSGFKSIFVESVSDPSAYCFFKPNSPTEDQDYTRLGQRDGWAVDTIAARAYFSWPVQAGKWMDIVVYFDSVFTSGSYVQISSGGVTVSEGTSATLASVTLTPATAAAIAPANTSRNTALIQNKTGADLYVGDSTVTNTGATEGIKIPPDATMVWKNAAALWGYSAGGGKVSRIEEA